jgi:uncharacterized membrane-anchored protein YhcB (DUF1043 family)
MEEEEYDINLAVAVGTVSGVIIGVVLGNYWRAWRAQKKLNVQLEKLATRDALDLQVREWVAENIQTMERHEFWQQLNGKMEYIRIVTQ